MRRGCGPASYTVSPTDDRFAHWIAALEAKHLAELTFPEVSRALRALSSTYVERRQKLAQGAALSGAGKRAAFALFYGPLHHLLLTHIVENLPNASANVQTLLDLGCGTGASGAAWAGRSARSRRAWSGSTVIPGRSAKPRPPIARSGSRPPCARAISRPSTLPKGPVVHPRGVHDERAGRCRSATRCWRGWWSAPRQGDRVLIVEPLAGFVARWWNRWRETFEAAGGRADEWRLRTELPPIVAKLDRAAGLNHREITGRSLWL